MTSSVQRAGGRRFRLGGLAGLLLVACSGVIGDPLPDRRAGGFPAVPEFAPGGLRLLTPVQYQNSIRELVGQDLAVEAVGQWRSSIAAAQGGVSLAVVEDYESAAVRVSAAVFDDAVRREAVLGCTPTAEPADACSRAFLGRVGRIAWRRPMSGEELERFATLASTLGASLGDPWRGLELAFSGLLQSPSFLYRVELGEDDPDHPDRVRFSSLEMASRLSYFIWNSTPDDELLRAAESGELDSAEGIARAATRLLSSERAREGLVRFYTDWLDLDALAGLEKDAERLPLFSPTIGLAMREQLQRTIEAVALSEGGSHLDLFDTRQTFVNAELARLYELPGDFTDELVPVTLPEDGLRGGLFGLAGLLAMHSGDADTSPTLRGKFVRNRLLCQDIPPPPADVMTVIPEPAPGELVTTRDLLERHRTQPSCAGCHKFMDPIGLALENFDALGQLRTTQNGLPIDPSGDLDGVPFADARGLATALRNHPETSSCLVRSLYRYATAHIEGEGEEAAIDALTASFVAGGHHLPEVVEALATSDAFRFGAPREPAAEEESSP